MKPMINELDGAELFLLGYAASEEAGNSYLESRARVMQEAAEEGEVMVEGSIVPEGIRSIYESFGMPAVSGSSFRQAVRAVESDEIALRINSPGGVISEAAVMLQSMSDLRKKGKKFDARVDGMAASAASLLVLDSERSSISDLGSIYVHRPMTALMGYYYSDELVDEAASLEAVAPELTRKLELRDLDYAVLERDGPEHLARGLTGDGTWIYATAAVDSGFVDRRQSADQAVVEPAVDSDGSSAVYNVAEARALRLRMQMHRWRIEREVSHE